MTIGFMVLRLNRHAIELHKSVLLVPYFDRRTSQKYFYLVQDGRVEI